VSVAFRSRWLDWTPGTPTEIPDAPPTPPPAKPTKPGYEGFAGDHPTPVLKNHAPSEMSGAVVCYSCWGSDFWQGSGAVVCRRCHPPAPGAEVLTSSGMGSGAPRPVEIATGRADTTPARTNGVRGGAV
jgi:hypothetical protein